MAENKYGNLLDKVAGRGESVSYGGTLDEERQRRIDEGENRYGDLLKSVNPCSHLDSIVNLEHSRNRKKLEEAEEDRRAHIEWQKRIDNEKREREERVAKNNAFVDGFLEKKRNEQERNGRERRKEADAKKLLDSIGGLIDVAPNAADAYVDVMVKLGM